MRLNKAAAQRTHGRDWQISYFWHFLAERRQQELDAMRAERGVRKRRARGIGKSAATYATALMMKRYHLTPTRVRQIVRAQLPEWKRSQEVMRAAVALSKALEDADAALGVNTKAAWAEKARIIDEADPESSVAKRRGKLRQKRLRDKLAKRVKRRSGKARESGTARERTQRTLEEHPLLSVYSTMRRQT